MVREPNEFFVTSYIINIFTVFNQGFFPKMKSITELSGLPASGKSTFVKQKKLIISCNEKLFPFLFKYNPLPLISSLLAEAYLFFLGFKLLSLKELNLFIKMARKEDVSFLYQINIFRNTLRKFSVSYLVGKKPLSVIYIDEGISHIPFNYLSSDFNNIIEIIQPYLNYISVDYIEITSDETLKKRLLNRGHARLNHIDVNTLITECRKVEKNMLEVYPLICKTFKVVENA